MSERDLPAELKKLAKELRTELGAEVGVERVPSGDPWPDRFRFAVVSRKFKSMTPLKRQDVVWQTVNRVLGPVGALVISVILTYSPEELEPASKPRR